VDDSDKGGRAVFKMQSKNDVLVRVNSIYVAPDDV
jgi:hypothetical protein